MKFSFRKIVPTLEGFMWSEIVEVNFFYLFS